MGWQTRGRRNARSKSTAHPACAVESPHLHSFFEMHGERDIGHIRSRIIVGDVHYHAAVVLGDLDVLGCDAGRVIDIELAVYGNAKAARVNLDDPTGITA